MLSECVEKITRQLEAANEDVDQSITRVLFKEELPVEFWIEMHRKKSKGKKEKAQEILKLLSDYVDIREGAIDGRTRKPPIGKD